ncbi:hypothetical protein CBS9595_000026 [Malassezia furfur]|nr:hypothetical protein CBS9595_000026 [Malassezia furfur]
MVNISLDPETRNAIIPQLQQIVDHVKSGGVPAYEKEVSRLQAAHDKFHEKGNTPGSFEDDQLYKILTQINQHGKVKDSVGTVQHRDELLNALETELNRLQEQQQ